MVSIYVFKAPDGFTLVISKSVDDAVNELAKWTGFTVEDVLVDYKFKDLYLLNEGTVINLEDTG